MRYAIAFFVCVLLISFDQWSKWWITQQIFEQSDLSIWNWLLSAPPRTGPILLEQTSFFNLVMVWNEGISFGLFSDGGNIGVMILTALSLIISAGFAWWFTQVEDKLQVVGIILVVSGALGNVLDRIRFGAVADFLDLHILGYHWPAFNAADSFICIGVFLLLVHAIFFEKTLQERETER